MTTLTDLLDAVAASPDDATLRQIAADAYEDHGMPSEAAMLRETAWAELHDPSAVRPPNVVVHALLTSGRPAAVICNYTPIGGGNPPVIEYREVIDGTPPYRYPVAQVVWWWFRLREADPAGPTVSAARRGAY